MIPQLLAAFIGTVSFAILFEAPRKLYVTCGVIGALGWWGYLLILKGSHSVAIATFIASLFLTTLSRFTSVKRKVPATIFLICGIFTLVPGFGLYNLAYYFVMNQEKEAMETVLSVAKIAIAISFGISGGYLLPTSWFKKFVD